MEFFRALLRLTTNEPLRQISERLYFQTTRIWLKSVFASRIDLRDEVDVFDREVDDILRAIEIGDLHAAALIQRAHISMSFLRLLKGTAPRGD
jgi:DNA-binding GntR family transcriptional regulator